MQLSFSEIKGWQKFEDLAAAYFTKLKDENKSNIVDVFVEPSGTGGDGGRDILVTFRVNDSIQIFERKWVVQCKFYEKDVSAKHLATVNIPSLIHQYGANGYLLICKSNPAKSTTEMFEKFRCNCRFCYDYLIWNGDTFIDKLYEMPSLHRHYFPNYYIQTQEVKKKTLN
jgi:hypothetical protein